MYDWLPYLILAAIIVLLGGMFFYVQHNVSRVAREPNGYVLNKAGRAKQNAYRVCGCIVIAAGVILAFAVHPGLCILIALGFALLWLSCINAIAVSDRSFFMYGSKKDRASLRLQVLDQQYDMGGKQTVRVEFIIGNQLVVYHILFPRENIAAVRRLVNETQLFID